MVSAPWCNVFIYPLYNSIECFHSRGQQLCKFIATKESVYVRKEFESHGICFEDQYVRRFIVLEHNMAAVTSCEYALEHLQQHPRVIAHLALVHPMYIVSMKFKDV